MSRLVKLTLTAAKSQMRMDYSVHMLVSSKGLNRRILAKRICDSLMEGQLFYDGGTEEGE